MPARRLVTIAVVALLTLPAIGSGASARASGAADATLRWHRCHGDAECAVLTVPVDDTVPLDGPAIQLAVVRVRARDRTKRIGSLVVNPGGPGASGVDFALGLAGSLPGDLVDRFDIVGFDPRGVGASAGVDCTEDMDRFFALDWAPRTDIERGQLVEGVRAFVDACERSVGRLLPYLTTSRAARDLDRLRAALGDTKLTYYGTSYGTYLGAWYAQQFPGRVRALVLDGALDPALDARALQVGQASAFERGLDRFLSHCRRDRRCGFHAHGHPARAYDRLRERVEVHPLAADDAGSGRTLNGTRFDLGVIGLLYDGRAGWGQLASALDDARRGDGSSLLSQADSLTGRDSDGRYDNSEESFLAIGCADGPPIDGLAAMLAIEKAAARVAPRLGPTLVNNSLACALWPVAAPAPVALHAAGAPPIVVVNTRDDPVTPLAWARGLARELDSGVLVTAGGSGHGAFESGNGCVDRIVARYLVDLSVPPDGKRC